MESCAPSNPAQPCWEEIVIPDDQALKNLKPRTGQKRYGQWRIAFKGLTIHCHDLAAFYIAAKDIFVQHIYTPRPASDSPVIIDAGAHIGLFSLYAKQRYPQAKITTFEPDPASFELLNKNLCHNGFGDITTIAAALHDTEGEMDFAAGLSDGSSLYCGAKNTTVATTPLSHYIDEPVDYLKLNVEGAELEIIQEIEAKLHLVQEICIEYHGFPELGQRLHEILAILNRHHFRYLIHDFDAETNPYTKPPFDVRPESRFFLLIYARQFPTVTKKTSTGCTPEKMAEKFP